MGGDHFKVRELLISVLPKYGDWCTDVTLQEAPASPGNEDPSDICAVTHNPLDCRVAGTTMCGVNCTECTGCTNCTGCTHCTACTQCTNCTQCTGSCTSCTQHCTNYCTGACTQPCTAACTQPCTQYCTNNCSNPSYCGATQPPGGGYPPGCGRTAFDVDFERFDPVTLVQLRGQLRETLARVEAAGRKQDEQLLPATIEEVDMLERKLRDALETLRERRAALERRNDE